MRFRLLRQYIPLRQTIKVGVIFFILALYLYLPSHSISAAAGTAAFSVSAPAQPINPGTQFSVSIQVQPNTAIAGAQFNLSFNPSLVTINSINEGNLLKQNGANTYFTPGRIDNGAGSITGVAGTIITPGATVSAPGTFAVIIMTASSTAGDCPLTISNVIAGDTNARRVPVSTVHGNITVGANNGNQSPMLSTIGGKTVSPGSQLTFVISAADPEGNPLTYSASNLPSGARFDASSRAFSWTPTTIQVGIYANIHFEVTDGMLTDSENITITVSSSNSSGSGVSGVGAGGGGGSGASNTSPVTAAANSIVGSDGVFNQTAAIKSDDGSAEVVVNKGTKGLTKDGKAVNKIVIVSVPSPAAQPGQSNIIGTIYDIGPEGATFDEPASLTLTYNPSLILEGVGENNLIIATWDTAYSRWVDLESTVNSKNSTVTAKVNHFSIFAVKNTARSTSFVVSDFSVMPTEVNVGDYFRVSALITNAGDLKGSFEVTLKMDGVNAGTKEVALAGGENQIIRFILNPVNPGTHMLSIGDLSAELVIKEPVNATFVTNNPNISNKQVNMGETVTISALVTNSGNASGTYEVVFKINGDVDQEKEIVLGAGISKEVSFDVQKLNPGSYIADVNGLSIPFVVKESAPLPIVGDTPTPTVFSLSLLAEIFGGAFVLITATALLIILRRRQLLIKGATLIIRGGNRGEI